MKRSELRNILFYIKCNLYLRFDFFSTIFFFFNKYDSIIESYNSKLFKYTV